MIDYLIWARRCDAVLTLETTLRRTIASWKPWRIARKQRLAIRPEEHDPNARWIATTSIS
jgi:hypothetical protein